VASAGDVEATLPKPLAEVCGGDALDELLSSAPSEVKPKRLRLTTKVRPVRPVAGAVVGGVIQAIKDNSESDESNLSELDGVMDRGEACLLRAWANADSDEEDRCDKQHVLVAFALASWCFEMAAKGSPSLPCVV
jgi:hypothetical protein